MLASANALEDFICRGVQQHSFLISISVYNMQSTLSPPSFRNVFISQTFVQNEFSHQGWAIKETTENIDGLMVDWFVFWSGSRDERECGH